MPDPKDNKKPQGLQAMQAKAVLQNKLGKLIEELLPDKDWFEAQQKANKIIKALDDYLDTRA